jgi:predicted AAA+ superfamily ATPase
VVVKAEDAFVKLENPYIFGVPVSDEDTFFGREKELRLIFDTLEDVPRGQKQDLVVLGPRRIGKSSLLRRLVGLLKPNKDFVPAFVDVQSIKPKKNRTLFLKVLRAIKKGYQQKGVAAERLPHFETLSSDDISEDEEFLTFDEDMSRLNDLIAAQGLPRLVLMFDEVELLVELGGRDTLDWFRSLIQSMPYSIFVVAGSEHLYSLTQDYGSPFYNIFKTVELHPLAPQAAKRLLEVPAANIGLDISSAEVDKILRYTGNNPYFINGIAHYLVQELNRQQRYRVYPQDVDKVIRECTQYLSSQLAYLWNSVSHLQKVILYHYL